MGVDVFFVISGFLITGQLLRRIDRTTHGPGLMTFYAARIRRLLPMSFLVLVVTLVVSKILLPPLTMLTVAKDGAATALYGSNMWFAHNKTDYLANQSPSVFQHYWSLALEEQFYLFWPLILLAVTWAFRGRRLLVVALLASASFVLCVMLTDFRQPWAFFTLPARAWELAVGALLALVAARVARLGGSAGAALGWAGLIGIIASFAVFGDDTAFPGVAVSLPVLSTAAVIAAGMTDTSRGPELMLRNRPFQWIGDRSYSLYLWHWPILLIPAIRWDLNNVERIVLVALAIGLSTLSYSLVEQPIRSARLLVKPQWRSYALGVGMTGIALGAAAIVFASVGPLNAGRPAPALTAAALRAGVPSPSYVPSNLTPTLRGATNDNPVVYADGCHLDFTATAPKRCIFGDETGVKVALIGDSHATQWFPGLRAAVQDAGGSLMPLTKSACPSFDVTVNNDSLGREYRECDRWRQAALAMVNEYAPDVVILTNFGSHYRDIAADDPAHFDDKWVAGLATTVEELASPGRRVVILGDSPDWEESVNLCLSGHLNDPASCAKNPTELTAPDLIEAERTAATNAGATFINTTPWLCADKCEAIAEDVLIYRDESHITARYSAMLAPRFAQIVNLS